MIRNLCHYPDKRYFRFPPHLKLVRREGKHYISGDDILWVSAPSDAGHDAIGLLATPHGVTIADLAKLIGFDLARDLVNRLFVAGVLQASDRIFCDDRCLGTPGYLNCSLPDPAKIHSLEKMHILIVGCGGIGCEVARHLVSSGIGCISLIDHDVVQSENLNRQYLFSQADIGNQKVIVSRDVLQAANPLVQINTYIKYIYSIEDLRELPEADRFDAVICCADMPVRTIRDTISEFALERQCLYAAAGLGINVGSWGPIVRPDFRPTYSESELSQKWRDYPEGSTPTPVSFGPTNSLISAALARDLIHVLMGDEATSLHAEMNLDFRTFQSNRIPLVEF